MVPSTLLGLVPSVLLREDTDITDAADVYIEMASAFTVELLNQELLCWKLKRQKEISEFRGCASQMCHSHRGV